MTLKEKVHKHCLEVVALRLDSLRQNARDLSESVANETKSSAGDKYETSRAMLHIEQEQIGGRIAVLLVQQNLLKNMDEKSSPFRISLGSLVRIGDVFYYLSVALGKMQIDGREVVVLSLQSPLGSRLKGLAEGDKLEMNGKELMIAELW
ncbi:MAG TPA: hypothetical protein PL009_13660 [Flavipsychrobacter sp.]|nr:hypothetical protein [Flavipsychrobacter sp.]